MIRVTIATRQTLSLGKCVSQTLPSTINISGGHINAILLAEFLRYRRNTMESDWQTRQEIGMFFDSDHAEDPHAEKLESWLEEERAHIWERLTNFGCTDPNRHAEDFRKDIARVGEEYSQLGGYYQQRYQTAQQQLPDDHDRYVRDLNYYRKLLDRLRKEMLINYFSSKGVLPSYSFPIHTVELHLPPDADSRNELRLQRDLKLAIREYAPGSDVVS